MHVAIITTFYPNSAEPVRAVFVRNLARALGAHAKVTVVAPIPYAPPVPKRPNWTALRRIARQVRDESREVFHPRYVVVPKVERLSGITYFLGILGVLRRLVREEGVDVLHAHCAYPDAVGVALAAAVLNVPFVITAHGSDINVYADKPGIPGQLRWALRRAAAVIAVSKAIGRKIGLIAPEVSDRVVHIPCSGVNLSVFTPRDRAEALRGLGLDERTRMALFVGQLVSIKAVDVLLQAWRELLSQRPPTAANPGLDRLVIVGDGPLRATLERTAAGPEFKGTVRFVGEVPQERVASWISASTVFCLPSRNEGTPNVIVEALCSGRPVVASAVGGIPDLITEGNNGLLVPPENQHKLAEALGYALDRDWDATQIAAGADGYTWELLAKRNYEVLASVLPAGEASESCVR